MTAVELKTCSYKGVEFLYTNMPTTGGHRLIKYLYPGSDKQSIELQGKFPRSHSITGVIPHDDYEVKKENLLRVLEDKTKGTLVHPTFGTVNNVISGQYNLDEKITDLGRATIVIPFEIDDATGIPVQSGNLPAQVQSKSNTLNISLTAFLGETYEVDNNLSGNFSDAIDNINNIPQSFDAVTSISKGLSAQTNAFRSLVNAFTGKIGDFVIDPASMADSINTLFSSVELLYESPQQTLAAFTALFNFGDSDPITKTNTVARVQRIKNRDVIRGSMKTQALSFAYTVAAVIDYPTIEDLQEVVTSLELQYIDIRENQLISNQSLLELDDLRVQSNKTFDDISFNTQQIITVNLKQQPLPVFVYSQYGDLDLLSAISKLNNIELQGFVEGDLRILTA